MPLIIVTDKVHDGVVYLHLKDKATGTLVESLSLPYDPDIEKLKAAIKAKAGKVKARLEAKSGISANVKAALDGMEV